MRRQRRAGDERAGDEQARDERGTGVVGSLFGMLFFLLTLLVAVQVSFSLYARSAVTAAAFDAARLAAGSDGGPQSLARAEAKARSELGRYGDGATFTWGREGEQLTLRVVAHNPGFLPPRFRTATGLDVVDRTVKVRIEEER